MDLLGKINCALNAERNPETYYNTLSTATLENRLQTIRSHFLVITLSWLAAMILMVWSDSMDLELLVLFVSVVLANLVITYQDYRRKKRVIQAILEDRELV